MFVSLFFVSSFLNTKKGGAILKKQTAKKKNDIIEVNRQREDHQGGKTNDKQTTAVR